jgi:UDP-glucose 4-epimerase
MMGLKVLVTGGAGFIASHIIDELASQGIEITTIDNLFSGRIQNLAKSWERIKFQQIDLRDFSSLEIAFEGKDIVIHLAANANVPFSVSNPDYDYQTNSTGTFNVLRLSLKYGIKQVIYASSAAVYGEPRYLPMDEAHPLSPVSPYGASKLSAELMGFAFYKTYGLNFTVFRIFNVFGPRQRRYVMYDLLNKLLKDPSKLEVLGTGDQVRDYVYVKDAVQAFIKAINNEKCFGNIYNLGGGEPITIRELVRTILKVLAIKDVKVDYTCESWKGDIGTLCADIARIRNDLAFHPTHDLERGIRELAGEIGLLHNLGRDQ